MTRRLLCALLVTASVGVAGPANVAAKSKLNPAQGAEFPERKWLLQLPGQRSLSAADLEVTEDGRPVHDLKVVPASGSGTFGVMLAIDVSPSMRSRNAIGSAMAAARSFAAQRPPAHRLGVMFFSGGARIALAPTTDAARIDAVLSGRPQLTEGTRMYDAIGAGFSALEQAGISAGSVVLLSDGCRLRGGRCLGADAGSRLDHGGVVELARRSKSRVFTIGLRSESYDPVPLHALASDTGGDYAEASSPERLEAVFDRLGDRLATEHMLVYRSPSRMGRDVTLTVKAADGDPAVATYRTPTFTPPTAGVARKSSLWWTSTTALVLFGIAIALLVGLAAFVLLRPHKVSVTSRINQFTGIGLEGETSERTQRSSPMLQGAERRLARTKWWPGFVEEVDVAGLAATPLRIALATATTTAVVVWVCAAVIHRPLAAGMFAIGIPWGVLKFTQAKARRQRRKFDEQLPDNLQVIASAMRAGHSFAGALGVSVDDASEPAKRELRRVVNDERLGVPVDRALDQAARRMDNRELEHVALVSQLQRDVGGNTAEVLDRLVETIRANADIRRLVRTLTAQGRLGGTIVSALPIVVALIINLLNPEYLDPLFQSGIGRLMLIAAFLMLISGWLVIRRIVDIKV